MDYTFIYEKKAPKKEPEPLFEELYVPQYIPTKPKEEENEYKVIIIEL
jgi:hypothetical protein